MSPKTFKKMLDVVSQDYWECRFCSRHNPFERGSCPNCGNGIMATVDVRSLKRVNLFRGVPILGELCRKMGL